MDSAWGFRFLSGAGGEFCTADGLNDSPSAAPDSEGFWFGGYGHSDYGNSRFAQGRSAFFSMPMTNPEYVHPRRGTLGACGQLIDLLVRIEHRHL